MQKERKIKIWQDEINKLSAHLTALTALTDTSLATINERNVIQNKITELEMKIKNVREGLPELGDKSNIYYNKGLQ